MDNEEIKNSIIERFNILQPEIQESIMNPNYENNLSEIGKKHNLSTNQMEELEFNTTLVLMGQTHPDEYGNELMEDLHISKDKADEVVMDINRKIFKPIIFLLRKNFEDDTLAEAKLEKEITKNEGGGVITNYQLPITDKEANKQTTINENKLEEDEVPKPPYGISSKQQVLSSKEETNTNSKGQIQVEMPVAPVKPIQEIPKSIFEEKLKGPTASEHTVSDYSTKTDPYREAF